MGVKPTEKPEAPIEIVKIWSQSWHLLTFQRKYFMARTGLTVHLTVCKQICQLYRNVHSHQASWFAGCQWMPLKILVVFRNLLRPMSLRCPTSIVRNAGWHVGLFLRVCRSLSTMVGQARQALEKEKTV